MIIYDEHAPAVELYYGERKSGRAVLFAKMPKGNYKVAERSFLPVFLDSEVPPKFKFECWERLNEFFDSGEYLKWKDKEQPPRVNRIYVGILRRNYVQTDY